MEDISFPVILSNSLSSSFTFTLPHYSHEQSVVRQSLYIILLECTLDVLFSCWNANCRDSIRAFPFWIWAPSYNSIARSFLKIRTTYSWLLFPVLLLLFYYPLPLILFFSSPSPPALLLSSSTSSCSRSYWLLLPIPTTSFSLPLPKISLHVTWSVNRAQISCPNPLEARISGPPKTRHLLHWLFPSDRSWQTKWASRVSCLLLPSPSNQTAS